MYEHYISLLRKFVSFKSVSTDVSYANELKNTAQWLNELLTKGGARVTVATGKKSNPLIIAELRHIPDAQTILVYGHYDVQPADQSDGWTSDPFVLTQTKTALVARGVVDNKGQILAHIVAVLDAYKNNTLAYNVVFLIEGNEESGNPDLANQLAEYKKKLACDVVIISDGEIVGDSPTLEASLRGGGNIRVIVSTAPSDQHSGLYGGAIPSSTLELTKVLATLKDAKNKVRVPGFYEGAPKITRAMIANNTSLGSVASYKKLAGVQSLVTETCIDPYTQVGLRPTLEITGFNSGYTGVGFKNIVPAKAEARINVRTVYGQNSKKVLQSVVKYITSQLPKYVRAEVTMNDPYPAISLPVDSEFATHTKRILKSAYKKDVKVKYVGGGIPVVNDFVHVLGAPVLLVSLGNDDCNMHGLDENYRIGHIKKALQFCEQFWKTPMK